MNLIPCWPLVVLIIASGPDAFNEELLTRQPGSRRSRFPPSEALLLEGGSSQAANQTSAASVLQQRAVMLKARKEAAELKLSSSFRKDPSAGAVPGWTFGAVPWFSQVLEEQRQHLKSQMSTSSGSRPNTAPVAAASASTSSNVDYLRNKGTLPTRSNLMMLRSKQHPRTPEAPAAAAARLKQQQRSGARSGDRGVFGGGFPGSGGEFEFSRPETAPAMTDALMTAKLATPPAPNARRMKVRGSRASSDR